MLGDILADLFEQPGSGTASTSAFCQACTIRLSSSLAFWIANVGDLSTPAWAAALAISLRSMMFCRARCSPSLRVLASGAIESAQFGLGQLLDGDLVRCRTLRRHTLARRATLP